MAATAASPAPAAYTEVPSSAAAAAGGGGFYSAEDLKSAADYASSIVRNRAMFAARDAAAADEKSRHAIAVAAAKEKLLNYKKAERAAIDGRKSDADMKLTAQAARVMKYSRWSDDLRDVEPPQFIGYDPIGTDGPRPRRLNEQPHGPVDDLEYFSQPLDFFGELWTDRIWNLFLVPTNANGSRLYGEKWTELTLSAIKAVFAALIDMGSYKVCTPASPLLCAVAALPLAC
jgi:hypothetical protein